MTAFAIFALTTAGPVQIQRISRERAPLSMMVLGRGSERLAISDRYDDFVYPGGGPVEKFFGPFPEGGFRLEVSAPIDSGDSWQLAAFVAHAVLASGQHNLCREVEAASQILCLTGTVDYDGQIGGVGHIAEKMQSAGNDLAQWGAGSAKPMVIVPTGEDEEQLLAREPTPGITVQGAGSVIELCAELDIPLTPATTSVAIVTSETPKRGGMWRWSLAALALLVAAFFAFTPDSPPDSPLPPQTANLPAPEPIEKKAAKTPAKLPAPPVIAMTPPNPPTLKPTPPKPTPPAPAPAKPVLKAAPQTPTPTPAPAIIKTPVAKKPAEKKPVAAKPFLAKPQSKPKPVMTAEVPPPRLGIMERHAPDGQACTAVYFGKVQAELRPVPVAEDSRFETSRGPRLCGLLLRIELGEGETYAVVKLEILSGRLVGALRPPPDLSGRRLVKGRHDWKIDLPHRGGEAVRYKLSLIIASTPIRHLTQPAGGRTITLQHEVLR